MDIILDNNNNDIQFANGDILIDESFQQEIELIIGSNQGEWKNEPLIGANLIALINSEATESEMKAKIKLALKLDNKTLTSYDNGKITVE